MIAIALSVAGFDKDGRVVRCPDAAVADVFDEFGRIEQGGK